MSRTWIVAVGSNDCPCRPTGARQDARVSGYCARSLSAEDERGGLSSWLAGRGLYSSGSDTCSRLRPSCVGSLFCVLVHSCRPRAGWFLRGECLGEVRGESRRELRAEFRGNLMGEFRMRSDRDEAGDLSS